MSIATQTLYHAALTPPRVIKANTSRLTFDASSPYFERVAMTSGQSRELPMPTVTRITSLSQAYATLQHCWARLSRSRQANDGQQVAAMDTDERRYFQRWLGQWEQAFTAYLSFAMAGMQGDDITRCRILKANHLACTILASEGGPDLRSFDVFEAEFQAMVDLATAVLLSRRQNNASASPHSMRGTASVGAALDVKDPLHVVVARCRRAGIRDQAIALLSRYNDH